MADSKTSHWQSLAADLSGIPAEDRKPAEPASDTPEAPSSPTVADESSESTQPPAQVIDTVNDEPIEIAQKESHPVAADAPTKKKKRGSWAFWRSGNKEKKDTEDSSDTQPAVSDDPLTLLNQAETTDDMACAIDQLFANSANDTRGDEVVFDEDEIATSIDFDEDPKTASRDADSDKSRGERRGDRKSRRRRDDDGGRQEDRNRKRSERSRNDRDEGRRRSNSRDDSRSRDSERRERKPDSRDSERRERKPDSRNSERRQSRRRTDNTERAPIDHGDVPTWDTAVSFVVDNNMVTRDGKSGGKTKSRSRSRKKTRD